MKIKYLILLVFGAFFASCTDNFEEFNTDVKAPTTVAGEALFSNAQISLTDQISSTNVNLNVWKLFSQYWTETTYTDESKYDIIKRSIPDFTFLRYYRGFLRDFSEAAILIDSVEAITPVEEVVKKNKLAIIELLNAYTYQQLVDIFGNVPYSEALNIKNIDPVYDDAFSIYQDLLARVDAALANLDVSQGSFGSADLIYAGKVANWIKFGNSLKIKLAVNLADYNEDLSKTVMEAAASLAFTSNDDNALLEYSTATPNTNPLYEDLVQSGRDDFVAANTLVDIMNALEDPRRDQYFSYKIDTSTVEGVEKLAYVGAPYAVSSDFESFSHIAAHIQDPTFHGILLTYDEVLFYLAEGAARGFDVGGTPAELYDDAITESFDFWGIDDASSYLANPAVAYATATGDWKQKIGTQEWIAFYTRGLEGYTAWRRLDYPIFNVPPLMTYDKIPVRFTYPVNEQTLNGDSYRAAAAAIGGDVLYTKLFWDMF